jgi:hypothetical protein
VIHSIYDVELRLAGATTMSTDTTSTVVNRVRIGPIAAGSVANLTRSEVAASHLSALRVTGVIEPEFATTATPWLAESGGRGVQIALAGPNPIHDAANLAWSMTDSGSLVIGIYDVGGRVLRRLVAGKFTAGKHSVKWLLDDDGGLEVASGVYYARIQMGKQWSTARLVVIR